MNREKRSKSRSIRSPYASKFPIAVTSYSIECQTQIKKKDEVDHHTVQEQHSRYSTAIQSATPDCSQSKAAGWCRALAVQARER